MYDKSGVKRECFLKNFKKTEEFRFGAVLLNKIFEDALYSGSKLGWYEHVILNMTDGESLWDDADDELKGLILATLKGHFEDISRLYATEVTENGNAIDEIESAIEDDDDEEANGESNDDGPKIPLILYHGTPKYNLESIRLGGLLPGLSGKVFLYANSTSAGAVAGRRGLDIALVLVDAAALEASGVTIHTGVNQFGKFYTVDQTIDPKFLFFPQV